MSHDHHLEETIGFDGDNATPGQSEAKVVADGQDTGATEPPAHGQETVLPEDYEQETIPREPAASGSSVKPPAARRTSDRRTSDRGSKARRSKQARGRAARSSRDRSTGSQPRASGRLPEVGDQVHHYEIIRELGRGGMGVVCLARDLRLARRVAIKFVRTEHPGLTERFLIEARTTARFHHENIVVIHDIGEHEGNPFMVLEFLQGRSLREMLDDQAMAPERAVELMIPVVRALERAHDYGIVHRDLKPANIFVTDAGMVKVLDFGIAKHRSREIGDESRAFIRLPELSGEQSFTQTGALVGTIPYMSPEQVSGGDVDHRTDIWAMGLILYELVTGQHPMAPLTPQKLQSIADLEKPMLGAGRRELSNVGKLSLVIERCLIKRNDDRMSSASELLAELESLAPHRDTLVLGADESPFAGLAAFQESEADRFFGRSQEIASIAAQLQSRPLVTLVGPSGAGKSSLVRAGVIPALKRSGEGWHSLVVRPGRHPLTSAGQFAGQPVNGDIDRAPWCEHSGRRADWRERR